MPRPVKKGPYPGRIIFDHLPKAAGQAVNCWLANQLGAACVTPNLNGMHSELIRRYGGKYSVISGHIAFDHGDPLDPRYDYVTLMREPVDRAVSWISYLLNDVPVVPQSERLVDGAKLFWKSEGKDTTPEFLESVSNPYVRHFSAAGLPGRMERSRMLDAALNTLLGYKVVGLYESMPDFLHNLAGLIGIPAPDKLDTVNKTTQRPKVSEITATIKTRIGELNELDLALYEKVKHWLGPEQSPRAWPSFRPPGESRWQKFDASNAGCSYTAPELSIEAYEMPCGAFVLRGHLLVFELVFQLHTSTSNLVVSIHIRDTDKRWVFGTNSQLLDYPSGINAPGRYKVCFTLTADFPIGSYTAGISFADFAMDGQQELAWHDTLFEFEVQNDGRARGSGYSPTPTAITVTTSG